MEEAADVGAPVGDSRQSRVQPERDLGVERCEIVVDVAGPGRRAESLHAGGSGPTEEEHARLGSIHRLPLGECLVTESIVDVVHEPAATSVQPRRRWRSFAAVEPPPRDAEPDQLTMRRPPPDGGPNGREIDQALALAI